MKLYVPNVTWSLCLALTMLRLVGFWMPRDLTEQKRILSKCFTFLSLMFLVGFYIYVQAMELFYVWGDISLMTSAAFMLFTNMTLCLKMINVLWRREKIQAIVDETDQELREEDRVEGISTVQRCDRQTSLLLYFYIFLSMSTVFGLAGSAEKAALPLRARYPYDTSKSPAFELTYAHQIVALNIAALVNISLDTVVTSTIAQCCCRLKLLALSLKTLASGLDSTKLMLSKEDEKTVSSRLRSCVMQHQAVLRNAAQIQDNFSEPIFVQFTVSIFIICVTAYQLAFEVKNLVRILSLLMYLGAMMLQVFLYCYQGNELSIQKYEVIVYPLVLDVTLCIIIYMSTEIASAAYECPWNTCSAQLRRSLLLVMVRAVRVSRITAGGITTLSLAAFTSIIKASYTFFTVLQSMQARN